MFTTLRGHTIYAPPLASGPVVLDLGANRGEFTRDMSARYGGSYYMVEANPALAAALAAEGPFTVRNCAVSREDGPITLNLANNHEGSSILELPERSMYNCTLQGTVEVEGKRLDRIIAEFGLDRIDLLKMDIEGAEGAAIASLSDEALRSVGQITAEFHCDPRFGFNLAREVEETIARLKSLGFIPLDFSREIARVDVLLLNRKRLGIRGSRAAALRTKYYRCECARLLRKHLPKPVKAVGRRLLPGGRRAGR